MNKELLYEYRIDYIAYVIGIIILDIVALRYPQSYLFLVPIGIVWAHMVVIAIADLKEHHIGTEFFLVFAALGAVIGRQERAIMFVLLIMIIARYFELFIERRTYRAIEQLIQLIPAQVTCIEHNREKVIPLDHVVPGMQIVVNTGARVPADGIVVEGHATINEAPLTGESMPREKSVNSSVFAGTFIESGSIVFRVERVREETVFGKMTALFAQAEEKKAHISILAERIVFWVVPLLLLFILLVWLISKNFDTVMTLLIFGSPLELSLVTPLAVLAGSVSAFRHGILVRGGRALEQLARVDTMIFDKTGTLTLGTPAIVDIKTSDVRFSVDDILRIAAIAELRSDHPFAKAIVQKADAEHVALEKPELYNSIVGHGVEIVLHGRRYFVGNQHFIEAPEHGNSLISQEIVQGNGMASAVYLATDGVMIGVIRVMDTVRPDARATIQELRNAGIQRIILLSGDRQEVTNEIARTLGITEAYGQAFPEDKLKLLDALQKKGSVVAMVGDGINDVAALKQAHVGIAMGAMGMEPAIEAADIVLMTNELYNIYFVRVLAKKVFRVIYQGLILGFVMVHLTGIVLSLLHLVTPVQAALCHAVSDILILLNATRLITFRVSVKQKE